MTSDRRRLLMAIRGATTPPPPLPPGYTALKYVENPLGNSAYVNTGILTGNNIGFYIDALSYDEFSSGDPITFGCLFGGRYGSNSSDFQLSTFTAENHSTWHGTLRRGTSSQNYNAYLPYQTRFQASLSGTTYTINGDQYTTATNITSTRQRNIYLFALNNANSVEQNGHARVYRFWLTNNGTKVIDYYPCKDSNEVVGFYDLVNEVFVPPTSGTFTGVL